MIGWLDKVCDKIKSALQKKSLWEITHMPYNRQEWDVIKPDFQNELFIKHSKKQSNMKFIIQRAKNKQFYYTLVARNGRVVMMSETYKRRGSCHKAVESMIRNVINAKIIDKAI